MSRMTNDGTALDDEVMMRATEDQIAASRDRLVASMGALKEQLTGLSDWREWVRRRPLSFVGGALALGILLGLRRG